MIGGFRQVIAEEGVMALSTGLGAAAVFGEQKAWDNRTAIYLGATAGAEFVADVFLCPLESCRIRAVSDPTYADGLG